MTTLINNQTLTTISQDADLVTLINVFIVEPENQQLLVDLLVKATEEVMCKLPGFISANIHKSLDGKRVTNYAQWRSVEDFRGIFNNPEALAHMPAIGKIAQSDPTLYEICYIKKS
ncbi:Antibiotic biosynthesis monooxygenase [Gloeocapsa sp. PCC 7428]|uniref:antibiotic biosynthesis monooxygenase family protein n=1 Tax=Gloeocapsa sp. PCC 7428 TaxID=1173026 RepID=UPI0002A602DF|nr:antibiotic biosynthesis monooxygenase family protein [Gloeocapsa sp. PCC 7428]AFZ33267.1 Antibiotic biosynthesis monooxygenase [Gloeocapsa sp. PCC 7428]